MKYTFILYSYDIVDLHIIIYICKNKLLDLTCTKNYARHIMDIMGRRE
jgi:hypothetical protein